MVKFLLENSAKAEMIDNNGMTALDYLQEHSDVKIKFLIEAHSNKKKNKP